MMKNKGKVTALVVGMLLLLMSIPMTVYASSVREPMTEPSFTVHIADDGKALPGVSFFIYQLASMDDSDLFTAAPQFLPDESIIQSFNAPGASWSNYTEHFRSRCVLAEPFAVITTDADGNAVFDHAHAGKTIPQGIWFGVPSYYSGNGYDYTINAFFVCVPRQLPDDNWQYTGTVDLSGKFLKSESPRNENGGSGSYGSSLGGYPVKDAAVKVITVWEDAGFEDRRPADYQVMLLGNGKNCGKVSLSPSNDWSNAWNGLESTTDWRIVQSSFPAGYESVLTREGNVFIVTNTYREIRPIPAAAETGPTNKKLPQTGLLWWIIPALAAAGILLFSAGWLLYRKGSKCEKQES